MKSLLIIFLSIFLLTSCIPLKIAPTIKEDKIKIAKRFKRHLPKQYALIFKDPKDADEFYHFINTKYRLNHKMVEDNVPFTIDGEEYSFSFYEVEKITKTINLLPFFLDAALDNKGYDPVFEDSYSSRKGHWYIALTSFDVGLNDVLDPENENREAIIKYLRDLRIEYLNSNNYLEALLKKQTLEEVISID